MPPRPKTAKLSQNPLKFKNKGDRPLIFPVNADTARKTTRQRTPSNFKFNGSPIIALLIAILVICLLGSFVFLDSFVLYGFLSYLRFLKCFSYFSFVDVSILPYLSLFVIWQSEHIFDCIFIYFLFYQYITSIPA